MKHIKYYSDYNIAQAGEAGANKIISAISNLTQKLGGPLDAIVGQKILGKSH